MKNYDIEKKIQIDPSKQFNSCAVIQIMYNNYIVLNNSDHKESE